MSAEQVPDKEEGAPESRADRCCNTPCCRKAILHPFGKFHKVWDPIVVIVLIYSLIEVPITLAFEQDLSINKLSGQLSLTCDCILCVDICVLFRTAYFDEWDPLSLVRDWRSIFWRYLMTWFVPDVLSSLPFEFFLPNEAGVASEVLKMLRLLKFARMFQMLTIKSVNREYLLFLKFVKVFVLMVLVTHLSACVWYFVGYETEKAGIDSWLTSWLSVSDIDDIDELRVFERYTYSWYWAVVTLFTTGYGDITATEGNLYECWVATIAILIGTCFVAYFIGNVSSLVMEGDRTDTYLRDRLDDATAFCDKKQLPAELTRAILTHILYHVNHNYVFEEEALIASLPPNIQSQIHQRLAQSVLTQLDFFANFQRSTGMKETLGEIALKMRSISCNEGFRLFSLGDRAKEIYIQRTGESLMDFHDGTTQVLLRGDVVGDSSVFSPKRRYSVTCTTFCEFYILPIRDIVSVLQNAYPTTWNQRWSAVVHVVKVGAMRNPKYVRKVDFDSEPGPDGVVAAKASSATDEQMMADQMALNDPLMDTNGAVPNGVTATSDESEAVAGDDNVAADTTAEAGAPKRKKKRGVSIPFIGRRSSLSRNDDIIVMAKRRHKDNTFVTHDLGVADKPTHSTVNSLSGISDSDHIGDIVPGIEVDEKAVEEEAARGRDSNMTTDVEIPGSGLAIPGKARDQNGTMVYHDDVQPSVQVELSQVREVEDDLDQVLNGLNNEI